MHDELLARRIPTGDEVTVSEAATYAFCANAWHLEHALRRPAPKDAVERRVAGLALHQEHGREIGKVRPMDTRLLFWSNPASRSRIAGVSLFEYELSVSLRRMTAA